MSRRKVNKLKQKWPHDPSADEEIERVGLLINKTTHQAFKKIKLKLEEPDENPDQR